MIVIDQYCTSQYAKLTIFSTDHEKKCLGGPNDQWVNNIDAHEGRCEYPNIGVPILLGVSRFNIL